MRQVLQDVDSGETVVETVPPPTVRSGGVRVRTAVSVVSAGTERMLLELANRSILGKAMARPDLVGKVWEKIKKEGILTTYRKVRSRLDEPMPLGYSAAGIVEEVGSEVSGLEVGDRVAMAGAGYANHAEVNFVPENLVARVPDDVSFRQAAYATVASIALQGVRRAEPELGDNVAVIGLGLIGLITVQLLKANGCRVLGIDVDPAKVEMSGHLEIDRAIASTSGDAERVARSFSGGYGVDRAIITAATESSGPVELAGEICRSNGRVVVVGAVGMDVPRKPYYEKELDLRISRSYGPGRYDPTYEEGGIDYPYDYVRWTEQRNMEAVLDLMVAGKIDTEFLTTHEFPFEEALEAYEMLEEGEEEYVGILLEYDQDRPQEEVVRLTPDRPAKTRKELGVGFVGAGNYATAHLLPNVRATEGADLVGIVTATGSSARRKADEFGFQYCTTEFQELLEDEAVEAVFIATRHGTHAEYTARALRAGIHVFVEKPLAVTPSQLEEVRRAFERAQEERPTGLMVGLNRRFAPMVEELDDTLSAEGPVHMTYRVNSGAQDLDSWLYRPEEGRGMLVGEMCHFIDLMQFVSGERPTSVRAASIRSERSDVCDRDNVSIIIRFDGGSVGTLCYHTIGDSAAPKERFEVAGRGRLARMNDFRTLRITRGGSTATSRAWRRDKGQENEVRQTIEAFRRSGRGPIPFEELILGMRAVFAARSALDSGDAVPVRGVRVDRATA